jgi:thioester reductase-like protein
MRDMLEKYAHDLPRRGASQSRPTTRNMTVLLTGSTGSLGSYLLDTLYHDSKVRHIICLDRSSKATEVHSINGPVRGLSRLDPSRVEFFKTDLSRKQFDLEDSVYQRLPSTTTRVIRKSCIFSIT